MSDLQARLREYAEVIVNIGLNLQKDQPLVIRCPIEASDFAHLVAEEAYRVGAKDVIIQWKSEKFTKLRYTWARDEVLQDIPHSLVEQYNEFLAQGAAQCTLVGEDPNLMSDIPAQKIQGAMTARSRALKPFQDAMMRSDFQWCVAAVSTPSWAHHLFPDLSTEDAMDTLWNEILNICRIEEGKSVQNWKDHIQNLSQRAEWLNGLKLRELHYTNDLGTDLRISLPEGHIWCAASEESKEGVEFIANIPTEEVFTLPHAQKVDGRVCSSMPLPYAGNLIKDMDLSFHEGSIIEAKASEGEGLLKEILSTDQGASRLGEVALVPYDSPISNRGLLFFDTLYDENASCHLALGAAYPVCLSEVRDEEDFHARGGNESVVHEDFMIGTKDLDIVGTTKDGEQVQIFKQGNWAD